MQTLICALIIGVAFIYIAKRWLPPKIKQRLPGQPAQLTPDRGTCSSCSSCGNCGNNSDKMVKK